MPSGRGTPRRCSQVTGASIAVARSTAKRMISSRWLSRPANQTAATDLFFREKAFWQFARGTRLGDLRRLIRQYGRTEDTTFPEGPFHKTYDTFGDDVNLPVPDSERTNPQFQGCLDRNA